MSAVHTKRAKSALDHYLPAGFLGGFSASDSLPRRERPLVIGDHVNQRCFTSAAEKVGAVNNLYTMIAPSSDPKLIDSMWSGYEALLPEAIDKLVGRTIDGVTWARVLVPFVTCLLLRGPDFNDRFKERIAPLGGSLSDDNVNFARAMELQRLLSSILTARWVIGRSQGPSPIITNDLGFAGYADVETGETGIAVPLNKRFVVSIVPRRRRAIMTLREGKWMPIIEWRDLAEGSHLRLNETITAWARRFIFGPSEDAIAPHLKDSPRKPPSILLEPGGLGFITGYTAMIYEFTWHRLVSYLAKLVSETECLTTPLIDWEAVSAGWAPKVVIMPTSHEISFFTYAIKKQGNMLISDLTEMGGLTSTLDVGVTCPS